MQESLLTTSNGFADNLMNNIEHQKESVKIPQWSKSVFIASAVILFVIPLIGLRLIVTNVTSSIFLSIPFILVTFFLMSKYLNLREAQHVI